MSIPEQNPLNPERVHELIKARDLRDLRDTLVDWQPADIAELIESLEAEDRIVIFRILPRENATETFEFLTTDSQEALILSLGDSRVAILLNEMAADDRTTLFEEMPATVTRRLLNLLSKEERSEALTLLGYPEFSVGRLMTPDYISVGSEWPVSKVLKHIREHGKESDSLEVLYVTDDKGKLVSEVEIRELLLSATDRIVSDLTGEKLVSLQATDDQESAVNTFKKYSRTVLPVIDSTGLMLGIVTADDVLQVAEEEASEDIQKFGGSEALTDPYLKAPFKALVRSRASWLIVLFIGEMLTASAMGFFSDEISKAVVLALFIPLIISSGGNSGSQAATLVIRALATDEIRLRDWHRVLRREIATGLILGAILGLIGFLRIVVWSQFSDVYGDHWLNIAFVVLSSLVAVVLWGTLTGSMLPFMLKKLGADPAASSAPFVATLVDVVGLVIYFTVASLLMGMS